MTAPLPRAPLPDGSRGPLPRLVTVRCVWCRQPFQRPRNGGGGGGVARRQTARRFCSRACILAAVGLPPDFDPAVLELDWHGRGPWGGRSYDLSEMTPAAEQAIRAVLDAVGRDAVPGGRAVARHGVRA